MPCSNRPPTGEKKPPRYKAPSVLPADPDELRRFLRQQFQAIEEATAALATAGDPSPATEPVTIQGGTIMAHEGDTIRVEPPAGGITVLLPTARSANKGQDITVILVGEDGPVTVKAVKSLVQDVTSVELTGLGMRVFRSDGGDGMTAGVWWIVGQSSETPPGPEADAQFVVGAANALLPNAAVGTDTAEVDFSFTPGGIATWALNTASVAFSKLANLTGLSVLGRAANSAGVMAAITATAGHQALRSTLDGTSLAWEDYLPTLFTDTVAGTLTNYVLPASIRHDDFLTLNSTVNCTLASITAGTFPTGFRFYLGFADTGGTGRVLSITDSAAAPNSISTPNDQTLLLQTGSRLAIRKSSAGNGWVVDTISPQYQIRDNGTLEAPRNFINYVNGDSTTAVVTPDATNNEHEVAYNYSGTISEVALSGITGNQGTVNIAALVCGGHVSISAPAGAWEIEGFTSKTDGFWFVLAVANTAQTGTLRNEDATPAVGDRMRMRDSADVSGQALQALVYYADSRWRVITSSAAGNPSEITNTTATGNLGTIDISTLTTGGSYRVAAASSSFSIEGFTSKPQGFWFYFAAEDDAGSDECTLFHEDATATATDRIRAPQRADIVGIGMRGILFYAGSRWNWVSDAQQRIGGATANVTVAGNGSITVDASGVLTMNSGAASAATLLGVSSLTLSSTSGDVVAEHNAGNSLIVLDDAGGAGFIEVQEGASSTPSMAAGRGAYWVRNDAPNTPMFTDDTNADRPIVTSGVIQTHTSPTSGNLGTLDISALACGGMLSFSGMTGAYQVEGFSGNNTQGFWFFISGPSTQTGTLFHEDATATAANRLQLGGSVDRAESSLRGIASYNAGRSRWVIV